MPETCSEFFHVTDLANTEVIKKQCWRSKCKLWM